MLEFLAGEGEESGPVPPPAPAPDQVADGYASILICGVTADGRGVGPRRVPRDQVVAVLEELRRSGYTPITGFLWHRDRLPGDFHAVPGPNAVLTLPGDRP